MNNVPCKKKTSFRLKFTPSYLQKWKYSKVLGMKALVSHKINI